MQNTEWISQLRRGIMEFCILILINKKPTYGYELVLNLSKWDSLAITEGTLYPLLRRLQKEHHIESYWQESESGPPRKYYKITESGTELLNSMSITWGNFNNSIDELLNLEEVDLIG